MNTYRQINWLLIAGLLITGVLGLALVSPSSVIGQEQNQSTRVPPPQRTIPPGVRLTPTTEPSEPTTEPPGPTSEPPGPTSEPHEPTSTSSRPPQEGPTPTLVALLPSSGGPIGDMDQGLNLVMAVGLGLLAFGLISVRQSRPRQP